MLIPDDMPIIVYLGELIIKIIVIRKLGSARSIVQEDLRVPTGAPVSRTPVTPMPDDMPVIVYMGEPIKMIVIRKLGSARSIVQEDLHVPTIAV